MTGSIKKWHKIATPPLIAVIMVGVFYASRHNYILFDRFAEIICIIIAFCVFMVSWHTRKFIFNFYFIFIGISYFYIGLLDMFHTLTYEYLPSLNGLNANHATQFWLSARTIEALSFAAAPFFTDRKLNVRYIGSIYCLATLLIFLAIFTGYFPDCYIQGTGPTVFNTAGGFILSLILIAAVGILYRQRHAFARNTYYLLILVICTTLVSELTFLNNIRGGGQYYHAGHWLKVLSFFCIYKVFTENSLFRPYHQLFDELKQSRATLLQEKQRLQAYLDIIGVIIVVINAAGNVALINKRGCKILGYDESEILGRNWFDQFLPIGLRERTKQVFNELMLGNITPMAYYENPVVTKEGQERLIWWHNTVIRDETGRITGTLSSGEDITERKEAERLLVESEKKYASLVEQSKDGIVIIQNGLVKFCNHAMSQMTGYAPEEMLGKPIIDMVAPEFKDLVAERYATRMRGEKALSNYELTLACKDGHVRPIELSVSLTDYEGEPATYGFIRDISERKQAEKEKQQLEMQLNQSQKMEAVGTLAGGIAHDFNNILAIIIGNAELALDSVPENSQAYKNIMGIKDTSLKAKKVVGQILSFSRQSPADEQVVRVIPILQDFLKMLRSSIPTTIAIHSDFHCEHDTILADATQINRILLNLCTNAQHAMRDGGGDLRIAVDNVVVPGDKNALSVHLPRGLYVRLTVCDTGEGIDPAIKARIFDPYFTTKGVGEGSGMGLAVVFGLIHKYRGAVSVNSELGKGTVFEVFLPVVKGDRYQRKKVIKESILRGDERILFVDDDPSLANVMAKILESLGYKVVIQTNPARAYDMFRENPHAFDLVITDATMPDMRGDQLAHLISKTRPDLPVILCTGYSDFVDKDKAAALGISAFLMKPISKKILAQVIRKVLDETHPVAENLIAK